MLSIKPACYAHAILSGITELALLANIIAWYSSAMELEGEQEYSRRDSDSRLVTGVLPMPREILNSLRIAKNIVIEGKLQVLQL